VRLSSRFRNSLRALAALRLCVRCFPAVRAMTLSSRFGNSLRALAALRLCVRCFRLYNSGQQIGGPENKSS
jgi:hypothetical protein